MAPAESRRGMGRGGCSAPMPPPHPRGSQFKPAVYNLNLFAVTALSLASLGALSLPSHLSSPPHFSASLAASCSTIPCTLGPDLPVVARPTRAGFQERQPYHFHGLNYLLANPSLRPVWRSDSPPPHQCDLPWTKEFFTTRSDRGG